uniref:VOC family protein n=1 Tax=Streptomyces resistomycificus TaxID=67356 RepID=UPI00055DC7A1
MEQRITLITLGVLDLARSKAFYEALGWRGQEVEETVFFQAGGLGLVLWSRDEIARDVGLRPGPATGFGGIALAHNVRSEAEVDELLELSLIHRQVLLERVRRSGRSRLGGRPQPRLPAGGGRLTHPAGLRPGPGG